MNNSLNIPLLKHTNIYLKILMTGVYISVIQQMPVIKEVLYDEIRVVLYFIFGFLVLIHLYSLAYLLKITFVRYFIYTLISSSLFYCIFLIFGSHVNFVEMLLPFGMLLVSINLKIKDSELYRYITVYIILSVIMSVSNVIYYAGGFHIVEVYLIPFKNQIGPIIGISIIILANRLITNYFSNVKQKNIILITRILAIITLISSLIVIRNRASILAIILVVSIIYLMNFKVVITLKKVIYMTIVMITLIILAFSGVLDSVTNSVWISLTLNYDVNDINSLSAGRTKVYGEALEYIKRYPFLGEVANPSLIDSIPHNYLINKLTSYGIIGTIPLMFFYIYLWVFTLKGIFKKEKPIPLVYWLMLFALVISQFEYTYPYGPGVTQLMLWLLLGQQLRSKYISKDS